MAMQSVMQTPTSIIDRRFFKQDNMYPHTAYSHPLKELFEVISMSNEINSSVTYRDVLRSVFMLINNV